MLEGFASLLVSDPSKLLFIPPKHLKHGFLGWEFSGWTVAASSFYTEIPSVGMHERRSRSCATLTLTIISIQKYPAE